MKKKHLLLSASLLVLAPHAAIAQQAPAAGAAQPATQLPPVEVIQVQPKAAPKQAQPKAAPKKAAPKQAAPTPAPVAQPAPQPAFEPAVAAEPTGQQYDPADGRVSTSAAPVTSPVNAQSIVPQNLQNFAGAASRVDAGELAEQRPLTNHEALVRVPGVVTVTDDGLARHGGIGIRGSNFRRSRKVLIMEDGQSINYSSYLDPSTHYTPPMERVENIEVVRGTIVSHGPLNNHGVINFQNLNPFGPTETVISGAISWTEESLQKFGNSRHIHTRQNLGNVGVVASYSGADGAGAWDNERLRYNDFYGALGWRGSMQDIVISGNYFRQRDDYDEDNFGGTREAFFANGWDKTGALRDVRTLFNTFNADYWRLQLAHNAYITDDITLSTRIYGSDHERNRFSHRNDWSETTGRMRGRNRDYEVYGADSRIEFANVPLFAGMMQDIQAGVRYEHHRFVNCTSFGLPGEKLDSGNTGNCRSTTALIPDRGEIDTYGSDSFAAFIQTAMHLTPNLTVTPGVRFEKYDVEFERTFRVVPPAIRNQESEHTHVLPGVALAWEPLPQTTLYAGYHRGFAPHIARDAAGLFPLEEEVGDNFQIGVRSTAIRGLSFDAAYFHSLIENYQVKAAFTTGATGANVFGTLDEVRLNGFELAVRADSRPFNGGPWNLFGEASYTYTDSEIESGRDRLANNRPLTDVSGNRLPFTLEHFASLTVGVAYEKIWDASMTWTYRGDFFTNSQNSVALTCASDAGAISVGCVQSLDDLVGGQVDSVWLLSARSNYYVTDQLSLFLAGHNLTNELYISELSDGAKPGQSRTITSGFKLKF